MRTRFMVEVLQSGAIQQSRTIADTAALNKSNSQRFLDFVEHPLFTGPVGTLSGLIGMFYFWPVFGVCGVCILLAFHRSGAVRGKSLSKQVSAYAVLFVVTLMTMFGVGRVIDFGARSYLQRVSSVVADAVKPQKSQPAAVTSPPHYDLEIGESHGTKLEGNVFGDAKIGKSYHDTLKGNVFGDGERPPLDARIRQRIATHAGAPELIRQDFTWLREQLEPVWAGESIETRDNRKATFERVKTEFMAVANNKEETLELLDRLYVTTKPN